MQFNISIVLFSLKVAKMKIPRNGVDYFGT